jgi:hypothetical protein
MARYFFKYFNEGKPQNWTFFVKVNATIKRCIQMMITGEVDAISLVRVDECKSKHMDFLSIDDFASGTIFTLDKLMASG